MLIYYCRHLIIGGIGLSLWKELLTIEDFRQAQRSGGYVVITDLATPNKVHSLSCSSVKEGFFKTKVIINSRRNGKYFWMQHIYHAQNWNAERCEYCK
jgi:hypothetical protein